MSQGENIVGIVREDKIIEGEHAKEQTAWLTLEEPTKKTQYIEIYNHNHIQIEYINKVGLTFWQVYL